LIGASQHHYPSSGGTFLIHTPLSNAVHLRIEAKDFAHSPEGKKLTEDVKEQASKPENRRKLKEFGQRFIKKR
jgi:hypothetical protein